MKTLNKSFLQELNDPRYFQILYLAAFLLFGINYLGWSIDAPIYLSFIVTAIVTQALWILFTTKSYHSIKSGLITALGLCLLLKTDELWVASIAALVAISSKFILRVKGKHIFNPANIGIVISILLTDQAWISPGQWGSSLLLWFFIGAAGLMMLLKVGRTDTTITFLLIFGLLMFVRSVIYLGWEPEVWWHQMSNGTLLLFAFFMITDPMTIPNHSKARMIWSATIAISLFIASSFLYIQTAAIWVLFLMSPFTPFFDQFYKQKKYEWNTLNINQIKKRI